MNRQKTILIHLIIMLILSLYIFWGLKNYSKHNFSLDKFNYLVNSVSSKKDKTDDLCRYHILGDPYVKDLQYTKINFWCENGSESRNTLALMAITEHTVEGVLKEFARIINFDYDLISKNNWYCLVNENNISDFKQQIFPKDTISCFENRNLYLYGKKNN